MSAVAALVLGLFVQEPPPEPAPTRPVRTLRSSVRIVIEERPTGEYAHDYYEQPAPAQVRTGGTQLSSDVWYRTLCRPQEEERQPTLFTVPEQQPMVTLSGTLASLQFHVDIPPGSTVTGNTRRDPIIGGTKPSKTGVFGSSGSDSPSDGNDAPFLYGTDLDYVAVPDLTLYSPTAWLPAETSFHLYGRALFGTLQIADLSTDLQLYGIGPRLGLPIARWGALDVDCTVSAGPAFLHTGVGDAVGFDGGVGLRFSQFFTRSFTFIAELEANYFQSSNVRAYGPVVNLGFNLSW